MPSVSQAQTPSRTDLARIIYTAMYSGHDVPSFDNAPDWRRHRAIIAAGLVMSKVGITQSRQTVTVVQQPPKPLRERIVERREGVA